MLILGNTQSPVNNGGDKESRITYQAMLRGPLKVSTVSSASINDDNSGS